MKLKVGKFYKKSDGSLVYMMHRPELFVDLNYEYYKEDGTSVDGKINVIEEFVHQDESFIVQQTIQKAIDLILAPYDLTEDMSHTMRHDLGIVHMLREQFNVPYKGK